MCTFCNKKNWKDIFTTVFLLQYEKRKLACHTLYNVLIFSSKGFYLKSELYIMLAYNQFLSILLEYTHYWNTITILKEG
jgi:hypothetical protein